MHLFNSVFVTDFVRKTGVRPGLTEDPLILFDVQIMDFLPNGHIMAVSEASMCFLAVKFSFLSHRLMFLRDQRDNSVVSFIMGQREQAKQSSEPGFEPSTCRSLLPIELPGRARLFRANISVCTTIL